MGGPTGEIGVLGMLVVIPLLLVLLLTGGLQACRQGMVALLAVLHVAPTYLHGVQDKICRLSWWLERAGRHNLHVIVAVAVAGRRPLGLVSVAGPDTLLKSTTDRICTLLEVAQAGIHIILGHVAAGALAAALGGRAIITNLTGTKTVSTRLGILVITIGLIWTVVLLATIRAAGAVGQSSIGMAAEAALASSSSEQRFTHATCALLATFQVAAQQAALRAPLATTPAWARASAAHAHLALIVPAQTHS